MKNFELFDNPRKIYRKMLQDIRNSTSSIYLETHMFTRDKIGNAFRKELTKKAEQGVKVILLVDVWYSNVDKKYFRKLISKGAEVRFFREILYVARFLTKNHERDHRKLLIIDDNIVYVGSANITALCLEWRELVVRIEGEIALDFKKSFFVSWENFSGKINPKSLGKIVHKSFEILNEMPSAFYKPTERRYIRLINGAKKEILIETPYFIPSFEVMLALSKAIKRGVVVKLITPLESDVAAVDILRSLYLGRMHQKGLKIFYYKKSVLHAKLLIVDTKFFLFGSSNLDYRSFLHQHDLNVFGHDQKMVRALKRHFKETLRMSEKFDYGEWKSRSSLLKIAENFLNIFREYF